MPDARSADAAASTHPCLIADPSSPGGQRADQGAVVRIAIDSLRPADSPRIEGVNAEHVRTLAEVVSALPPILVRRATMQVVDGMHRLSVAKLSGHEAINVEFFDGSDEEAFLLAVRANNAHGLPLTLADRRAAAERIMVDDPRLSDRAIAAVTGLAARTVAAIRHNAPEAMQQSNVRIGRDGRIRPLDSAEGRRIAGRTVAADPGASLRTIARQAGISIGTARDVRRRVMAGEDPVPAGPRARTSRAHSAKPLSTHMVVSQPADADPRKLVEGLSRDPSLRYTDAGRSLLRWLGLRTIAAAEWRGLVDEVPPHCPTTISRIARACAASWLALADELDRRDDRPA